MVRIGQRPLIQVEQEVDQHEEKDPPGLRQRSLPPGKDRVDHDAAPDPGVEKKPDKADLKQNIDIAVMGRRGLPIDLRPDCLDRDRILVPET